MKDDDDVLYDELEILLYEHMDNILFSLNECREKDVNFDDAVNIISGALLENNNVNEETNRLFTELVEAARINAAPFPDNESESILEQITSNYSHTGEFVGVTNSKDWLPIPTKRPSAGRQGVRIALLDGYRNHLDHNVNPGLLHARHFISYRVLSIFLVGMLSMLRKNSEDFDKLPEYDTWMKALYILIKHFNIINPEHIKDITDDTDFAKTLDTTLEQVAWDPINIFLGPAAHNLAVSSHFDSANNEAIYKGIANIQENIQVNNLNQANAYTPYRSLTIERALDYMRGANHMGLQNVFFDDFSPDLLEQFDELEMKMEDFVIWYLGWCQRKPQD